ncbi:hypothetical protein ES703_39112 [subsurface metagenome]
MNGNQLVRELIEELSKIPNLSVTQSSISKRGRVFQLEGKINGFIYVHAIASSRRHYWGITKNTAKKIKAQKKPWCVILLYESKNTGYVISSAEYHKRIKEGLWPYKQGDYKISERKSLFGVPNFSKVDELVVLLSDVLSE